jgi:uncharacterized HAD superfamily protein
MESRKLALIDIDGVLADDSIRIHYALDKNWIQYFSEQNMMADKVLPQGWDLITQKLAEGYDVELLTGRREDLRGTTRAWLWYHEFPTLRIHMKPMGTKLPLATFKANYMLELKAKRALQGVTYSEMILWDDDPEVVREVQKQLGSESAVHCTWYIKKSAMVTAAKT